MAEKRGYGVGLQSFPEMIKRECVYVDKTAYVYKMAQSKGKNFFLSRPRRFGKSLLVSTLEAYFQGRKELFRGLAIEQLETEWTEYPVIWLNLSLGKYYEKERVHGTIDAILRLAEDKWGMEVQDAHNYDARLTNLIKTCYERTGRQVVVLIDEYDAPMLDSITNRDLQDYIRERIRSLFSPLKAMEDLLRFVFLTGISKFSQLSVFSELNNLNVLTFDPEYEGVCGITADELVTQLKPDIEWLAEAISDVKPTTYDETLTELKRMYDGYHFSYKLTDVYNPWSLIYAFEKGWIENYWFSTGTPSSLINLLRVRQLVMPELEGYEADLKQFDAPTERIEDPIPVLFQSGYLTIKGYNPMTRRYRLGFPNAEVYEGFADSLYKYYCPEYYGSSNQMTTALWDLRLKKTTFEQFLESVRRWYAGIPYSITDKNQNEQFYQALFYSLMAGIGADVEAEGQTSDGRFDIAMKLADAIYILEFKFGGSAEEATEQIVRKDYATHFAQDPRPVWAVGLNISKDRRTIDNYIVVSVK